MLSGRFFIIESTIVKGENNKIFRYIPVSNKNNDELPIFLNVKSNAISFYYQHTQGTSVQNQVILTLPLEANVDYSNSLDKLLIKIHSKSITLNNNSEYHDVSKDSLARCSEFYLPQPTENNLLLSQLVLDFIFDWEYSFVFDNLKNKDEISAKLQNIYLFNAIADKARYLFYKKKYQNETDNYLKKTYSNLLNNSEKQWINIIINEKSIDYFIDSNKWFLNVENEYKNVLNWGKNFKRENWIKELLKRSNESFELEYNKKSENQFKKSSISWFLSRYDIVQSFNIKFRFGNLFIPVIIVLMIFIFGSILLTEYSEISIIQFSFLSSLMFFSLFLFLLITKSTNLILPKLLMSISSSWFLLVTSFFWTIAYDISTNVMLFVITIISIIIVLYVTNEIKNITPYKSFVLRLKNSISFFIIGLFYSFNLGLIAHILLTNKVIERIEKNFNDITNNYSNSIILDNSVSITFFGINHYIFTNLLLISTFLALFIGIFIQFSNNNSKFSESV